MADGTEQELFEAVQSFDHEQAKQLFGRFLPKVDSIVDNQNATLLHVAANYNNLDIITHFLSNYDAQAEKDEQLYSLERKRLWLNRKDNEGFTCLHYAVFRGNASLAFLLQENGADIYAINRQGLSVLHIAAQGDSPLLMYYYMNKGLKISAQDAKGSTALHWACYSGQENAAYALLAWGAEIDKQDSTYGMTPLHLAVMSGNGRIVKKLLVRGCDRGIKNYSDRLPLDIAVENEYKNITEMIVDRRGLEEFFNIKTPYRRIGKFTFPFYFLVLLFLSNYLLNVSFVLFQHFPQGGVLAFVYLIIGLAVIGLFLVASRSQPGFVEADPQELAFDMLKGAHASKICFDCMLLKPERSRHCEICQRCVSVYDHHCPWVANCVGARNYCLFYTFLLAMDTFLFFTIAFEVVNMVQMDWEDNSVLEVIRKVCVVYSLICCILFLLPLTYLLYVQTVNCLANQTTFERYGYQNRANTVNTKTTTQNSHTETLRDNLMLKKASNMLTEMEEKEAERKSTRLQAEVEAYPSNNCYQMCFANADNIAYQIGKIT